MDFRPAVDILGFAAMFFLAVFGDRWLVSRGWRDSLVAYRLRFPSDLSADAVAACLSVVSGVTRRHPVVFEVTGTARGIEHHILVPCAMAPGMVSRLSTSLPGIRVQEAPGYLADHRRIGAACELRTSHSLRPLAADRAGSAVAGLLSALYPLGKGEVVRIQWIVCGTHHIRLRGDPPPEVTRAARQKQSLPLVDSVGRVAVSASHGARARMLMVGVLSALHVVSAPGVSLTTRLVFSRVIAGRIYTRALPLTVWPALLNTGELAAVIGVPESYSKASS